MRVAILLAAAAVTGCANEPMSPEQYQAIQRAMDGVRQPSTYQIVQPQPVLQAPPPRLGPITCRTYRNLGGQIQTDCN